jgi:hypothetical protein
MFLNKYYVNKQNYLELYKQYDQNQDYCIRKIGEIQIKTKPVIAISEWEEINLSPGTYIAYSVDDNLMLVNKNLGVEPDKSFVSWNWTYSGKSIRGDSGTFGFYDFDTIKKITTTNDKKSKHIPQFNIMYSDDMTHGDIINGRHLFVPDKEINSFAAVKLSMHNNMYDCYLVNNDRAILIAANNQNSLSSIQIK